MMRDIPGALEDRESRAWIGWSGPGCLCKSDVKERTSQDFAQTATTHLPP